MSEQTQPTWLQGAPEPIRTDFLGGLGPTFGSIGDAMDHLRSTASDRVARSTLDRNAVRDDVIEGYACDCRSLSLYLRSGRSIEVIMDRDKVDWRLRKGRQEPREAHGAPLARAYPFALPKGSQYVWRPYDLLDEHVGKALAGVSACAKFFYFQCQGMEEVMVMSLIALDHDEPFLEWGYA